VDAINASGTGVSCTLDSTALDPSSQTTAWTVYDYNPSNHALAPRNSPNKMPATTSVSGTTFDFLPGKFTALLTTTDRSLTGDLSFGGLCFFETGVTVDPSTTSDEMFSSNFSEMPTP